MTSFNSASARGKSARGASSEDSTFAKQSSRLKPADKDGSFEVTSCLGQVSRRGGKSPAQVVRLNSSRARDGPKVTSVPCWKGKKKVKQIPSRTTWQCRKKCKGHPRIFATLDVTVPSLCPYHHRADWGHVENLFTIAMNYRTLFSLRRVGMHRQVLTRELSSECIYILIESAHTEHRRYFSLPSACHFITCSFITQSSKRNEEINRQNKTRGEAESIEESQGGGGEGSDKRCMSCLSILGLEIYPVIFVNLN